MKQLAGIMPTEKIPMAIGGINHNMPENYWNFNSNTIQKAKATFQKFSGSSLANGSF